MQDVLYEKPHLSYSEVTIKMSSIPISIPSTLKSIPLSEYFSDPLEGKRNPFLANTEEDKDITSRLLDDSSLCRYFIEAEARPIKMSTFPSTSKTHHVVINLTAFVTSR